MKSKLLLYTLLSASMLSLGSCKSHRSMNIVDQALFQVQPGMTFAQVQAILDKPDYRRFNQEFEQWEYRRIIKRQPVEVILLFKDGALCEMDSFRPVLDPTEHPFVSHSSATASAPHDSFPDGPQVGMPYADFNRMCSLISAVTLIEERLNVLNTVYTDQPISCIQAHDILQLFSAEHYRSDALNKLAPGIMDWENYDLVLRAFKSIYERDKAFQVHFLPKLMEQNSGTGQNG